MTAPGWYPDGSGATRWFDGAGWTENVALVGSQGAYALQGELGQGAFGTVYLATHPVSGQQVAIKVFSNPDAQARADLMREANALVAVRHGNCLQIMDVIDSGGTLALVTDFVPGATLRAMLDQHGALSGPQALQVLWGAGHGLAAVHAAGLVHGDVKPANMLVQPDGVSKLIDFGLVGVPGLSSPDGSVSGSPAYAAPEQMGVGTRTPQSDIYALSVTLYEVLANARPYRATSVESMTQMHATAPVPDLREAQPTAGPLLAALVHDGMAKNPAERPQNMAAFLNRFQAAAIETYGPDWLAVGGLAAIAGGAAGAGLVSGVMSAGASAGSAGAAGALTGSTAAAATTSGGATAAGSGVLATVGAKVAAVVAVTSLAVGGGIAATVALSHKSPTVPLAAPVLSCDTFQVAPFTHPVQDATGLAVDAHGDVFVANNSDTGVRYDMASMRNVSAQILKVSSSGTTSVFAGNGRGGAPVPGPATASPMDPQWLAVDRAGNIYASEWYTTNGADAAAYLLKITPSGVLSVIAGTGSVSGPRIPGPATSSPVGAGPLAVDSHGDVFMSDGVYVDKVTPSGQLSIVAGNGVSSGTAPPKPGRASESPLNPWSLAIDSSDNLYVADGGTYLDKVTPTGQLSIIAGNGQAQAPIPGPARNSPLSVRSLAVDLAGNVVVGYSVPVSAAVSNGNEVGGIARITPAGVLSIVAGNGAAGALIPGDALRTPVGAVGLAVGSAGTLYASLDPFETGDGSDLFSLATLTCEHGSVGPTPNSLAAPCDPQAIFAAAEAKEHFSATGPGYGPAPGLSVGPEPGVWVSMGPDPSNPGPWNASCDQGWAIAAVGRPNVGTTDGLTVFRFVSGRWVEFAAIGYEGQACALTRAGVPAPVAARLALSPGTAPDC